MTAIRASHRATVSSMTSAKSAPGSMLVEVLEDVGCAEPVRKLVVQPARVPRSISPAVADEDRRHWPKGTWRCVARTVTPLTRSTTRSNGATVRPPVRGRRPTRAGRWDVRPGEPQSDTSERQDVEVNEPPVLVATVGRGPRAVGPGENRSFTPPVVAKQPATNEPGKRRCRNRKSRPSRTPSP